MSKEQANLTPQEQSTLFDLLKRAGQQAPSGGLPQNTSDPQAQAGVGNVDYSQLQQLEGDKIHPADAIAQIGQTMLGPQAPSGVDRATGPKIQVDAQGRQFISEPSSNPILKMFGVKSNSRVDSPNFFDTLKQAGIDKYLPSGLAQTPDGTPFVGPKTAQEVLQTAQSFGPKSRASFFQVIGFDEATKLPVTFNSANGKFFKGNDEVPADEIGRTLGKTKPQLSESQTNDITNLLNSKAQLNEIKNLFSPSATGPIQSRLLDFQASTGIKLPDIQGITGLTNENVKLRTLMASSVNDYIKAITGAQMSEVEARRILKAFPSAGSADEAFAPALSEVVKLIDMKLDNRLNVLESQGVVGIDKIRSLATQGGNAETPPPAAATTNQPHFSSVNDVKAAYQAGKLSVDQAKALYKAMNKGN